MVASLTLEPHVTYGSGNRDDSGIPAAGMPGPGRTPPPIRTTEREGAGSRRIQLPRTCDSFYFKPPFRAPEEREEVLLSSMLSTKVAEGNYPGDATPSDNWPNVAPGKGGMNNAISPKYCDLGGFAGIDPKPPVLWIRGTDDALVSDASLLDFGFLGKLGAVPGWPGEEVYPPQPMVSQTRAVLEAYARNGGSYRKK